VSTGKVVAKEVTFNLTEAEFALKAKMIAAMSDDVASMEGQLKDITETLKSRIKIRKSELRHQNRVVLTGKEVRVVECQEIADYDRNLMRYWYQGSLVADRPMTDEERQLELLPSAGVVHSVAPEVEKAVADL
jgi:hypothetical protein